MDGIQDILIKNLPRASIDQLVTICNKCYNISYWPMEFAKVTLIRKPGKTQNNPSNFRHISLRNAVGKLMERNLHRKIEHFVYEEKKLFCHNNSDSEGNTQQLISSNA